MFFDLVTHVLCQEIHGRFFFVKMSVVIILTIFDRVVVCIFTELIST